MTITACVIDFNGVPLSDDFLINDDDFSGVTKAAENIAESGAKCCIRWNRDTDGQVAYWGPSGSTINPRWYIKQGRPPEMANGKKVNTYLDAQSIEIANRLGDGNVSEGIRKALKLVATSTTE